MCDHVWGEELVTKPSTCSQNGGEYLVCTICGSENRQTEFERLPHTPSDWIVDSEATEESAGERHKECTICGAILDVEVIPRLTEFPWVLVIGCGTGAVLLIVLVVIIIIVKRRKKR